MLPHLLLVAGCLSFGFAIIVLRSDSRRWDGRLYATLGMVDGALAIYRSLVVLYGQRLWDFNVLDATTDFVIVISYLSLEFAALFPAGRPMSWRWRAPTLAMAAAAIITHHHPATAPHFKGTITFLYFLPMFVLMVAFAARNLRRAGSARRGAGLVIGAIVFRWASGIAAFGICLRISNDAFARAILFESTVAQVGGLVLMGYAVLRNQLFSVRSAAIEILLYGAFVLLVVGGATWGVRAVFLHADDVRDVRLAMSGVALGTAALVAAGILLRTRIEEALLRRIDPRRALGRAALARVADPKIAADPQLLTEATRAALGEVTEGGDVRWLATLPAPLAKQVLDSGAPYLSRAHSDVLPPDAGDLLVPVRAGTKLYGALAVTGGHIDRPTLLAAASLADNLALKLENHALFGELESARRLAVLGSFAAAIAHDIRTPLTSIQMNVQILRGKAKLPPDDMEHFDIALDELRRLNNHITEILDYAKPVKLLSSAIDLREIAEEAVRAIEPVLADKKIPLEQDHAGALPHVMGDPQRIRQVLWNLLDNAAKASDEGRSIRIATRAADGNRVAVEIQDHGRGIEAADLPKIFEPFFTTRPDGTGLGLAICHKLVQAHDGEIQVRSAPGAGSTFTILFPAAAAAAVP